MNTRDELLKKIHSFKSTYNLSDRAIGLGATKDHRIVQKLQAGRSITIDTLDLITAFIENYKPHTGDHPEVVSREDAAPNP